ncbi:MAG: oligopeptide ABC transporter permease [Thermomicrobiales bacterium]
MSTEQATAVAPRGALPQFVPDLASRPPRGPWQIALGRLKRAKLAIAGMIILLTLVLAAIFAPVIAPYGPNEIDLFNITASPSTAHWLGTDELGRDVLTRLIYGGRLSLWIGVASALLSTAVGVIVGAVSGYYGGWIDGALMRFVDLMLAFPSIFLLLIIFAVLEGVSVTGVILFLGLFGWMWLARVIRGEFLSLKQRDFIDAARSVGATGPRIIIRHLMPNVVAPIIVSTTLEIAYYMLAEAGLSFLGFGVPAETPTWGNMLNSARSNYLTHPILAIAPGLTLTIAVLSINFIGDGLRDALDPRAAK